MLNFRNIAAILTYIFREGLKEIKGWFIDYGARFVTVDEILSFELRIIVM